jgi:hypothetical protein
MHRIDPDRLPEVSRKLERFLLDADGEADVMMLTGGTEIHFPLHMAEDVCRAVSGKKAQARCRGIGPRKEKAHGHGREAACRS